MIKELIYIILLTFAPFLELRASIPFGILKYPDIHWSIVFVTAVLANIVIGIIMYFFMDKIVHIFLRWKWFHKIYYTIVEKIQHKIHNAVEKYGELGVAIFIGIPLPGSGVYSAAIGSYLIGLEFRKFIIANIIGVLIAGIIVTIVTLTGSEVFSLFVK